jgi:hypothetical protein
MIKINEFSRVLNQKVKTLFFYGFPIDHLPIPDLILKLYTFNILLFELFLQTGSRSMQEQQKGLRI